MDKLTGPQSADLQRGSAVGVGPGIPTRFINLLSAPREAFAAPRSRALWVVPLLLMLALSTTQSILLRDLALEAQMERIAGMDMPEAQKDAILDAIHIGPGNTLVLVLQLVLGAGFSVALWYLLPALLYWLGLNFGLGAKLRYGEVLGVTMLTALLHILRELIRLPIMLATGTLHVYTGPAALVDPSDRVLLALLMRFDLFDIYRIFLLVIGFSVLTGLPAKRSSIPVLAVWLLATIVFVGVYLSPLRSFVP